MSCRYYDLNVCLSKDGSKAWTQTLEALSALGYSGVAINRVFSSALPASFAALPAFIYEGLAALAATKPSLAQFRIYSRATLVLDNASINFNLASASGGGGSSSKDRHPLGVDLLSVCPTTEKLFQLSCTQLEIDIISLNLDERLPFFPKHAIVGAAIKRGIHFELCYKNSLLDQSYRRTFMSQARNLISVTRGKNLLLTSGASEAFGLRSPSDLGNLCFCLGLAPSLCKGVLSTNARSVLYHAATRKLTYKARVALQPPASDDALAMDFIALE